MVNSEELGKRLQKIMEEYDLNATNFADKIDVGRSSISHILSGRNKPSLEFVMKVIETFPEVELYWLLNGKGTFPKEIKTKPEQVSVAQKDRTLFDMEENDVTNEKKVTEQEIGRRTLPRESLNDKPISRIVIFYTDGTFENYNPG